MAGSGPASDAAPAAWDGTTPLPLTEGFSTPESVLHDEASDVYLVSNINGEPLGADDNGFISQVSPDGKVTNSKWIDGSKDTVKLDAPKGVRGRNSDNTMIKRVLGWAPSIRLEDGLERTYRWIHDQMTAPVATRRAG